MNASEIAVAGTAAPAPLLGAPALLLSTSAPQPDAPAPLLEAHGLTLKRGTRTLVAQLDWQARGGELWCLLGPNGVGKTTLLHALAGVLPAHGVHLNGRALGQWDMQQLARERGFMPQQIHDAFSASALDTVLLGRHPHLGRWAWEGDDDMAIARQALDDCGMAHFAQRDVVTLSGGERQRVGLAMLLAQQPRVLLLDEPASHQDLQHQVAIFKLLRALADEGRALVAAVHDINLAARFATHALLLDGAGGSEAGTVDQMLTPERLTRIFHHPVRRIDDQGRAWFIAE